MRNTFLIILLALFLPAISFAFTSDQVINYGAPEIYVYPDEFDKLVLDILLPSGIQGESDILQAIVLQNQGTAKNLTDISKLILWQDAGEQGFQGMGVDKKIGEFNFNGTNYSWYLRNLDVVVPVNGLRIFVSAEIQEVAGVSKNLKMKLPALLDYNSNGKYDLDDLGVYLDSGNNGPSDNYISNPYYQTIRSFSIDNLAPKAAIVEPVQNEIIATTTYIIKGEARDQGGSTPKWVKIALTPEGESDVWLSTTPTSNNYLTWQYDWASITEGTYNLKVKSMDWFDNEKISERIVKVKVEFPVVVETPVVEEPAIEPEPEPSVPVETLTTIEQIKAEIARVQQLIIDLLQQLIEIIQEQLK